MIRRLVAFWMIVGASCAAADDGLWKALEGGGRVVLIRHTITTPGAGDPPGMRLDDCSTQRNLTDEGRRHARAIGEAFRTRRIAVDRVLSSPWCRCLETARLAFGDAEASQPLANLFGRPENARRQVEALRALIATHRGRGNLILVTHGSTILALTGISPDTGEMVVVTPEAASVRVEGRLLVTGSASRAPYTSATGSALRVFGAFALATTPWQIGEDTARSGRSRDSRTTRWSACG